jgi:hypothetical protein
MPKCGWLHGAGPGGVGSPAVSGGSALARASFRRYWPAPGAPFWRAGPHPGLEPCHVFPILRLRPRAASVSLNRCLSPQALFRLWRARWSTGSGASGA